TVAEDDRPLAVYQGADELGRDGGVGRIRVLARAEDIEVAQRDGLDVIKVVEDRHELLAGELGDGVRRERVRREALVLRRDFRIAIDGGRRGEDDPSNASVAGGNEQVQRAGDVDGKRGLRIGDRARDGGQGTLVIDQLDAVDGAAEVVLVAEVAFHQLNIVGDVVEVAAVAGGEVVEDADVLAIGEEAGDEMGANESGAAGDENAHVDPYVWLTKPTTSDPSTRAPP